MRGESIWPHRPFADLTESFDSKRRPVKESERKPGPYPYYGASGIVDHVDDYIFDGEYLLVAEDGENLRSRQTPIAFMARGQFWVNNHAHVVTANPTSATRYLMYALREADVSSFLTGSTMPKLTQGNLNRVPVVAPPLHVQNAIARILGALDDKIDLNRRTNETLEAMARALFQSWFVDFDPVRAKAEGRAPVGMDEETAGLFPEGFSGPGEQAVPTNWRRGTLGDIVQILDNKRIPLSRRERELRPGPFPYYGAASAMDSVDAFLFEGVHVLMGEDGSVVGDGGTPVLQYVWDRFWVNNHAHVLRGKGVSEEFLLLTLQRVDIRPFVTGAVQPKLSQGNMNRVPVVVAPSDVQRAFDQRVTPLFARIRCNAGESATLAALRDTLLPKLLSGELSVAEAETTVGRAL